MPINPLIANPQNHVGNALGWIADQNLAQQRNALVADRTAQDERFFNANWQDRQNALAAQTEEQQEAERAAMLYPRLLQGDPEAVATILQESGNPELQSMYGQLPPEQAAAGLAQVMESLYGFKAPPKAPGPIQMQSFPGMGQALVQDGEIRQFRAAPQPQQYGPESFSPQTTADGSIVLIGNRGTVRPTQLRGQAKADAPDVKAAEKRAQSEQAWNLYETAMEGMRRGLEGAQTGPIVGRLPAFTAAQQTAEGGVAAMAPVLKQLFRVAGEGVFTDRDQQLLLDMVPKRTDLPEARDAKIANIDAIVKAKLGLDAAQPAGAGGLTPEEQAELDALRKRFGK